MKYILSEDTVKIGKNKWANVGDDGKQHGTFRTKKEANAQRKAMFANGYKEDYNPYEEYGSRKGYLKSLADDYGVSFDTVLSLADVLGPSEDFDALVSAIEDYAETQNDEYTTGNPESAVYIAVIDYGTSGRNMYRFGVIPYYEDEMDDLKSVMDDNKDKNIIDIYKTTEEQWDNISSSDESRLRNSGIAPSDWEVVMSKQLDENLIDYNGYTKLTRKQIKELNKICAKYNGWKEPKEIRQLFDDLSDVGIDVGLMTGIGDSIAADGAKSWQNDYTFNGELVTNSKFIFDVYEGNQSTLKNEYNIYFS